MAMARTRGGGSVGGNGTASSSSGSVAVGGGGGGGSPDDPHPLLPSLPGLHLARDLLTRLQAASPALLLASASAGGLVACYLLFPRSTRAFFRRLLLEDRPGGDGGEEGGRNGGAGAGAGKRKQQQQQQQLIRKKRSAGRLSQDESDGAPSYAYADRREQQQQQLQQQEAFFRGPHSTKSCVAVFWDVDNCAPPSGMSGRDIALAIRKTIQDLAPPGTSEPIICFKAYLELSSETAVSPAQVMLRSELQGSGVSLIDTPKSGRKQVADQMMITDLLAFAIDHPAPGRIVLISGDRDFAYALGTLRNRGFSICLITPPAHVAPILEASAHTVLRWRQDVLGVDYDKDGKPYAGARAVKPGTASTSTPSKSVAFNNNNSASTEKPSTSTTPRKSTTPPSAAVFKPLIDLLEQMRKQGQTRPLRSGVAAQLKSIDKDIFERAGASRWAEYAAVAEAAGLITLGGTGVSGQEWVSLATSPDEGVGCHDKPMPVPPSPKAAKARAVAPPPGPAAMMSGKTAGTPFASVPNVPPPPLNAKVDLDSPEIQPFLPLIELMNAQRSIGIPYPKFAYLAKCFDRMISQGVSDAYAQAGAHNFAQYLAAAENAKVARPQGEWVKLHPRYIGVHTSAVTPAVGRMEDTANIGDAPSQSGGRLLNVPPAASAAVKNAATLAASIRSKIASGLNLGKTTKLTEDETRAALYEGLIEVLREQRAQKHYYSADFFVQLVLARLPGGELFGRNVDAFNAFLDQAERDGVVLLEPGFGHGRRHVRLAGRYHDPAHAEERMGGDTLPVAGFELPARPSTLSAQRSTGQEDNLGKTPAGRGQQPAEPSGQWQYTFADTDDTDVDKTTTTMAAKNGHKKDRDEELVSLVPPSLLKGMLPNVPTPPGPPPPDATAQAALSAATAAAAAASTSTPTSASAAAASSTPMANKMSSSLSATTSSSSSSSSSSSAFDYIKSQLYSNLSKFGAGEGGGAAVPATTTATVKGSAGVGAPVGAPGSMEGMRKSSATAPAPLSTTSAPSSSATPIEAASNACGTSTPSTGTASASAADRVRYKPLIDSLVHLWREYQIVYPSLEQLHAELRERASSTSTSTSTSTSGTDPAFNPALVNPRSIDFVQWLSGAADLGLIKIERYEEEVGPGPGGGGTRLGKARLQLAERYIEMFKLS